MDRNRVAQVADTPPPPDCLIQVSKLTEFVQVSPDLWKTARHSGLGSLPPLEDGVEYVKIGHKLVLYRLQLCLAYIQFANNPARYHKVREKWLKERNY